MHDSSIIRQQRISPFIRNGPLLYCRRRAKRWKLLSTVWSNLHCMVFGVSTFFLHFGVKTLFYARNDWLHFCVWGIGNKGFCGSQSLLTSLKIPYSTWLKSCGSESLKPLVHLPFGSSNNACLHFFYAQILQSIQFKIGVEWVTKGHESLLKLLIFTITLATRNQVYQQWYRGFESHPLRQNALKGYF